MLIYEKDNKLNISFENNMDETDIVVGKDEISVDGNNIVNGGSGGGVNVLTLYIAPDEVGEWYNAFLDENLTQGYDSYEDAKAACTSADIIKLVDTDTSGMTYIVTCVQETVQGNDEVVLHAIFSSASNAAYGILVKVQAGGTTDK